MRRTEDLIDDLAHHGVHAPAGPFPGLRTTLLLGGMPAVFLFLLIFGIRPNFWASAMNPYIALRGLILLVLAGTSLSLVPRLGRPGSVVPWSRLLWPLLALVLALILDRVSGELDRIGASTPVWVCMAGIFGLGAFPIAAILWTLSRQATTRPVLAGGMAGLAGGAIGAALYALWCIETAPGYIVLWYGLSLALCSVAGAVAGRFLLRW